MLGSPGEGHSPTASISVSAVILFQQAIHEWMYNAAPNCGEAIPQKIQGTLGEGNEGYVPRRVARTMAPLPLCSQCRGGSCPSPCLRLSDRELFDFLACQCVEDNIIQL